METQVRLTPAAAMAQEDLVIVHEAAGLRWLGLEIGGMLDQAARDLVANEFAHPHWLTHPLARLFRGEGRELPQSYALGAAALLFTRQLRQAGMAAAHMQVREDIDELRALRGDRMAPLRASKTLLAVRERFMPEEKEGGRT